MSIEKRLDRFEKKLRGELLELDKHVAELKFSDALSFLLDSFKTTRVAGLTFENRRDHLQIVHHFSPKAIEGLLLGTKQPAGEAKVWRLFHAADGFAWAAGFTFRFPANDTLLAVGDGLISCEHTDHADEFLTTVQHSDLFRQIKDAQSIRTIFDCGLRGLTSEFIKD